MRETAAELAELQAFDRSEHGVYVRLDADRLYTSRTPEAFPG